ncbi:unnamed protein product [Protopolystoma xenopodis]|uniref:Uncharacterized protein n=1 Tax=Protopolystoma xenopodis TaxID=117903 RepID=A0A3S5BAE0_9PLAT|nr:unnamed protein product [Protopolystoma xenopodis]
MLGSLPFKVEECEEEIKVSIQPEAEAEFLLASCRLALLEHSCWHYPRGFLDPLACSDDIRDKSHARLARSCRNRGGYLGDNVDKNVPVKPTDRWSREMRSRLLVESTFESHHTFSLEMKVN